jgi:CheY-like chemotaxis protein
MYSALSPSQIILVEDNPGDVGLVREALREHGVACNLRVISDGPEFAAYVDQLDADQKLPCPDLLLLDLSLPKSDGWEVMKYLRASERCAKTAVVILTSSDWIGDRQNAVKHAAARYFRKPYTLDQFMQLGAIVKEIINGGPS